MSTNLYWIATEWHDEVHIGKRHSIRGLKLGFIWAQLPTTTLDVLKAIRHSGPVIIDEYARTYTAQQAARFINKCDEWNTKSIGREFS